jgi:hypothetical protein
MFGFRLCLFPVHFSLFEVCIISILWVIRDVYQSAESWELGIKGGYDS